MGNLAALTVLSLGVSAAVASGVALLVHLEADHRHDLALIGATAAAAAVAAWWTTVRALRADSPVADWALVAVALMAIGFAASIGAHFDERRLTIAVGVAGGFAAALGAGTLAKARTRQTRSGLPALALSGPLVEWAFDGYAAMRLKGGLGELATRAIERLAMVACALEAIGRVGTIAASARDRRLVALAGLRGALLPRSGSCLRLTLAWRGRPLDLAVRESTDVQVIREVLRGGYDLDLDTPPKTIVDLGAHIGLVSLDFAARWPGAVVWSVEPDPANFRLLERNLAACPQALPLQAAVAGEPGPRILHAARHPWDSSIQHRAPGSVPVTVACHTLDSLIEALAVDRVELVKIDIEGAEYEVLANCRTLRRIDTIVGEFHEDQAGVRPERFFCLLADRELEVRRTAPLHYTFRARQRATCA